MKNKLKIICTIFPMVITGCGGNTSEETTSTITTPTSLIIENTIITRSGRAIDGILAGSTVCIDTNANNDCSDEEASDRAITDTQGNFIISSTSKGSFFLTGGQDLGTGLPFTGSLKAPEGSTVVTPLTSAVQSLIESGESKEEAENAVKIALGIDPSVSLTAFDPIKALNDPTLSTEEKIQAQSVLASQAYLQVIVHGASAAVSGVSDQQEIKDVMSQVFADVAILFKSAENKIDLQSEDISQVIQDSADQIYQNDSNLKANIVSIADSVGEQAIDTANIAKVNIANSGIEETLTNFNDAIKEVNTSLQDEVNNKILNSDTETVVEEPVVEEPEVVVPELEPVVEEPEVVVPELEPVVKEPDEMLIQSISVGTAPHAILSGDFNHDGKIDLALTDAIDSTLTILLRNTQNTDFEVQNTLITGEFPISLDIGDFNNDGKSDLIVANYFDNSVSIFTRNEENTGFNVRSEIVTEAFPFSVNSGDFNNDGKDDFAIVNKNLDSISIFIRNETNTGFKSKIEVETGRSPTAMVISDFNQDGKIDFAVTNADSDTVSVLLRSSDNIAFEAKIDLATGISPWAIAAGDFNGDRQIDLAVINANSNTVSVFLRHANNTSFTTKQDFIVDEVPEALKAGDFNNDGLIDLAIANSESDTVSILLRNSSNTGFEEKFNIETGSFPHDLSVEDFDKNGQTDLAITNIDSNDISIIQNISFN